MNILHSLLGAAPTSFKLSPKDIKGLPTSSADSIFTNILQIVYFFGGVACVIVIIIAGILYATSGGDSAKVQQAKDAILYAVIGLVVIMMAFVITGFIIGRF